MEKGTASEFGTKTKWSMSMQTMQVCKGKDPGWVCIEKKS